MTFIFLDNRGLEFAPTDVVDEKCLRHTVDVLNRLIRKIGKWVLGGEFVQDEDGEIVRDPLGNPVRDPIEVPGIEIPPNPPGPLPPDVATGIYVTFIDGDGNTYLYITNELPQTLMTHVHPPGAMNYGVDGFTWEAAGAHGAGSASIDDGVEKWFYTGPNIDGGGGFHYHRIWMTGREAWDGLVNSGQNQIP